VLIREANRSDAAGIARVHVDVWRTTYQGIVPDDYLASLNREKKERRWRQMLASNGNDFAFVAENKDKEIIGFASAGKNQDSDEAFAGELYTIYLLESYQRRGIGKLLFKAVVEHFARQETSSMLLWVLAENPFRAFYESLGGERVSEKEVVIGDMSLIEVAYGWKSLDPLLER
jgi:ribosomal protein S18 acetylase RimI-like enzyme